MGPSTQCLLSSAMFQRHTTSTQQLLYKNFPRLSELLLQLEGVSFKHHKQVNPSAFVRGERGVREPLLFFFLYKVQSLKS